MFVIESLYTGIKFSFQQDVENCIYFVHEIICPRALHAAAKTSTKYFCVFFILKYLVT